MFELITVTLPTVGLAYVTATSPHARRRHREWIRRVPPSIAYTTWVLCCHHGRWILWQVTTYLPRKRT